MKKSNDNILTIERNPVSMKTPEQAVQGNGNRRKYRGRTGKIPGKNGRALAFLTGAGYNTRMKFERGSSDVL